MAVGGRTALAFPGAVGAAATTPGGRGGAIIRVTTLAPAGPGSFLEAVKQAGPRIVVFEVGGVIDLGESTVQDHRTLSSLSPARPRPRPASR